MQWHDHSKDLPEGTHTFISPSKHYMMSYNREQLFKAWRATWATTIGDYLHLYARDRIRCKNKVTRYDRKEVEFELLRKGVPANAFDMAIIFENFKNYVNDAIGFQLRPEQALKYSTIGGTADAISFEEVKGKEYTGILRIHDYKSGLTPASMKQLEGYAALYHLEYKRKPGLTKTILRIYQSVLDEDGEVFADIREEEPEPELIAQRMDIYVTQDKWYRGFIGDTDE